MNVETWILITRIIAIISIGTLVGQASARLLGLVKRPFFEKAAAVIECSALLAALVVTLSMISLASGKLGGDRLDTSVGTLQDALYLDLAYMARSALALGAVVTMFYAVGDGASRRRTVIVLVLGACGAVVLFSYLSGIAEMFVVVLDLDPVQATVFRVLITVFRVVGPLIVVIAALLRLTAMRSRLRPLQDRLRSLRRAGPDAGAAGSPVAADGEPGSTGNARTGEVNR